MAAPMRFTRLCQFHSKLRIGKLCSPTLWSFHTQDHRNLAHRVIAMRNSCSGRNKGPKYPEFTLTPSTSSVVTVEHVTSRAQSRSNFRLALGFIAAGLFGFGKKKEDEEEDELIQYIRQAHVAEHDHDFGRAEQMYHYALDVLLARASSENMDEREVIEAQVHIYDNMANLALASSQLDKAEKLFKETLKGLVQLGRPQNDDGVVEISLKLAMIYVMQQRYEEAHAGYKFCIDTQGRKLEQEDGPPDDNSLALLGMCVNSYARFYIMEKNYKEATVTLERAVDIAQRVFGENHPQVAVLLNDLATVASLSSDYDTAKKHASHSVAIGQKIDSPDLAALYCNMCAIYMEAGDLQEARQYCKEAKSLAKKIGDKETQSEAEECLKEISKKLR